MSLFLPSLKRSGHLEQIHITVCVVGSRKITSQDDYGSQDWKIFAPNLTIYGFDADTDTCEQANADLTARQVTWTEKHIPLALWNSEGKSTLYVTKYPGCSSLYSPSNEYIDRFFGNSQLIKLADTEEVETITLDTFCYSEKIDEIDFIQLDVQGAELPVLQGASSILARSTLCVVTEVEFTELYTGQPLFGDIDVYLRKQGFTLFDLSNMNRDIRRIPLASKKHEGVLVWSDAFYFRDLIREDLNTHLKTPEKILKLACIADVLSFPDYALEILVHLTLKYGKDERYNFADNIIESLAYVPGLMRQEEILASLPIVEKIREYSSSYNHKHLATNYNFTSNDQSSLHKRAYQCLLLGEYSQSVSFYEQAIELEPNIKSNYWYLGLLLLLQGQEAEAQATWFLGIAEVKPEEIDMLTAELVQILQTEAERRDAIEDNAVALAIRENIKAIATEHVVNNLDQVKKQVGKGD